MEEQPQPLGTFEDPRPYDILCGRNRNSFNNIGNRRFRITINMNVEKYNSLRSRHERSKFIASLAHTLRYEVGFRFLKKKGGKNSETIDLTDDEVRAKIGHALRDLSTVLRENGGDDCDSEDAKVPRPGPYQKSDKQLKTAGSSCSLETVPTGNRDPDHVTSSSCSSSSSSQDNTAPRIEPVSEKLPAPDHVRSSTPPMELMMMMMEEGPTPLKSNQKITTLNKIFAAANNNQHQDDLKLFPLEVGDACQSLLAPPFHDDEDDESYLDNDFWTTHSELERERSARSQRTAMSVGTFDLQSAERSGRSQRTTMSLATFDMSLSSCLSDAIETLSLVST